MKVIINAATVIQLSSANPLLLWRKRTYYSVLIVLQVILKFSIGKL